MGGAAYAAAKIRAPSGMKSNVDAFGRSVRKQRDAYQLLRWRCHVFVVSILLIASSFEPASAQPPKSTLEKSQAGFLRLKVGDVEVIALSDGTVPIQALEELTNAKPGEIETLLAYAYQKPRLDISVNVYLIILKERLVLVDVGAGDLFGPTLKKLPASLAAAGYQPEQITDILVTHIHTDHTGGLMDGKKMVFPNATLHMDKRESLFWLSPANRDNAPGKMKKSFQDAMDMVGPYAALGRVKNFEGVVEILPNIRSRPSPGHTPGHSCYILESNGEKLLFLGDVLHVTEVQLPNPSITIKFDVDSNAAAEQRKILLEEIMKNGFTIAAAHASFPGVGKLRADGTGYRWIPIPYVNDSARALARPKAEKNK
jgi:glyoxylase-like metal-dependent hydrolase (beta-lactamase superfamily II)